MPHHICFYPVGNGDTSQIILENGQRFLFDFHQCSNATEADSPEIDLFTTLKKELEDSGRTYFDVVAFTHGDADHIKGSTEFFELNYAGKYQGDGRIQIRELWVPAAMILETAPNDKQSDEFVIWRQEARYRLKEGKGIRVFSKPEKLENWLKEQNISLESRKKFITDAGELVPGFSLQHNNIEFFCHSPFIKHVDDGEILRNEAALIFNIRLKYRSQIYDYLAIGDSCASVLSDIVEITEYYGNEDRLVWDIFNIPHHCSYLALNSKGEKGAHETVPDGPVERLLKKGTSGSYMISSSNPIDSTECAYKATQPPHIQAKNCYKKYLLQNDGAKLLVTMEEPNRKSPKPLEFIIAETGIKLKQQTLSAASIITSKPAPRAG